MLIKIGDKEYSDEEVKQMIKAGNEAQEQLKVVNSVTEKYGIDTSTFVEQAQNAFGALVGLQESGVIDAEGNVVQKAASPATPQVPPKAKEENNPPNSNSGAVPNADEIATIALGKVEGKLGDFQKQIESLQQSNQRLGRAILNGQLKKAYPNLDDEEIDVVMSQAVAQKKDVWEVAKIRAEKLGGLVQNGVKTFSESNNINMEEINKLNEMRSKEGGLGQAITEGKNVSFKKGDANTLTPREATEQHMKVALHS